MNNQIPKNGLMTNHTSPIEIWDSHTPISIDRMRIIVDNSRRCPLPNEVESRVKRNWKRFPFKRNGKERAGESIAVKRVKQGEWQGSTLELEA